MQKESMTNNYTKDDAFNFFMEYTHWRSDAKLVRRWFNMSGDSVKWMQDKGVEFLGVFKYFKNSKETQHMVKVPGANKPTERCASVMIKTVTDYAREIGVEFQLNTSVKEILVGSQGQVRGVIAVDEWPSTKARRLLSSPPTAACSPLCRLLFWNSPTLTIPSPAAPLPTMHSPLLWASSSQSAVTTKPL